MIKNLTDLQHKPLVFHRLVIQKDTQKEIQKETCESSSWRWFLWKHAQGTMAYWQLTYSRAVVFSESKYFLPLRCAAEKLFLRTIVFTAFRIFFLPMPETVILVQFVDRNFVPLKKPIATPPTHTHTFKLNGRSLSWILSVKLIRTNSGISWANNEF